MDETSRPNRNMDLNRRDAASFNDGAIEWFYDVALGPLRMETLVDDWESAVALLRTNADFDAPDLLIDRKIMGHFERAKVILARAESDTSLDQVDLALSPFKSVAAFVVDRYLKIKATNDIAVSTLGLGHGKQIRDLLFQPADLENVFRLIRRLLANDREDSAILSLRATESTQITIFRLELFHDIDGHPFVILAANGINWPTGLNTTLTQVFGLTTAETDVLRSLVESGSINDVAIARGRSVDTIRGQIKSILSKTETRSQVELVRLTMSIMEVSGVQQEHGGSSQKMHRGYAKLADLAFRTIVLPDGRKVDYLVLGDQVGRPLLYLSTDIGLIRWPAQAEVEAARRGLRVIVPIRPGYGGSDPVADDVDYAGILVSDAVRVLDAEQVEICPILSIADDSCYTKPRERRLTWGIPVGLKV